MQKKKTKIIFSANEQEKRNQDILIIVVLTILFLGLSALIFGTEKACLLKSSTQEIVKCINDRAN